ncbi:response regulator [Mariniflexile sp. AS56]|uniref:response regulator n=1 Tax=Mariniflexile sp. AS56 TaxID=3063957 RepID=UPI0026EDF0DF|nr:response regulator [Mariniflexile sp. AS56]MDO7172668.1 response regulator [Mariniflexile sp. AS56]
MKTIFLAEDDPDDREFFEDALKRVSIPTVLTLSNDGVELMGNLKILTQHPPPHLIFLDLNMPKMDGFQCLQEIRNTPKYKEIPIVIFSTTNSDEAVNKTYDLGANFFIRKPPSFALLIKAIEKMLTTEMWEVPNRSKEFFFITIE